MHICIGADAGPRRGTRRPGRRGSGTIPRPSSYVGSTHCVPGAVWGPRTAGPTANAAPGELTFTLAWRVQGIL